ncbi:MULTISPECIES: cell division protein FtsZ [Olivibacter]|jgi:cell division protein FtsZ|uniref:Cell division protein FtsZ n=2 Tax=Olivibacter TaxID=376469 RepID=A0ABV6HRJ6_9SPHI|nr:MULTISPECIES: cell division protein FtsZ [Olivibacter]MCL4640287.1 cell division protein FtsZ [Olivibacter sp. UJ_SKK_5.1]MDM8174014.1 cell division protein FtsZ [Olivibacter sp. 47]MDX3916905.1 cell division protein FtsZ [Pseudosphingobacterium sp.]QEL03799.1 cell division protein FtsZ [Olivibacter sp. LS-1]
MKFEMLKEQSSIIKVIGVGGGGGNAVNHMYRQGISGVDFIICNTDAQALELSPIPNKVQLGASLTEGMGAGSDPDVGENSAIESIEDIKRMLGVNTKMLFITAGMGGGTGTGASPVIAKAAKELGILTVAIVTTPFAFEGKRRRSQAEEGLGELRKYVDSYLVISNDRLREIFGNLTMSSAFAKADDILTTAAKGIAEIITIPGYINVDFKDVRTVMNDSGVAIMGNAKASGDDRAQKAVEGALASPLLKDSEIEGARYILLNISSGTQEVTMDEISVITDYIQERAGFTAEIIWGNCLDESLDKDLSVTIIATGFQTTEERKQEESNRRIAIPLEEEKVPLVRPVNQIINKPKEEVVEKAPAEPVQAKVQPTAMPQADLFSGFGRPSGQNPVDNKVATPKKEEIIRHTLVEEEPVSEQNKPADEYQLKVSESEFLFTNEANTNQQVSDPAATSTPESVDFNEAPKAESTPVSKQVDEYKSDESIEEQLRKTKERILRLKDLSMKLRSTNGLQEIENEPAYRRKQRSLDQVPHSSESQVSRFTLSSEDGITEIRPNNSFLHDNVD